MCIVTFPLFHSFQIERTFADCYFHRVLENSTDVRSMCLCIVRSAMCLSVLRAARICVLENASNESIAVCACGTVCIGDVRLCGSYTVSNYNTCTCARFCALNFSFSYSK